MSEPAIRPQAVYFDSNILIGAGWPFPSAQLLEILRLARSAGLDVCLPDLVRREITAHWLRGLQSARQDLAKLVKVFNRDAFGVTSMAAPDRLPNVEELIASHDGHTKQFIDLFRIVSIKDRPASYYTEMALRRRGAFGEKGKGFHDTIILTGILEDMTKRNYTHAILVSKDGGFRQEGVGHLTDAAKVKLTIIESLAALETPVKEELNARKLREMIAAKLRVINLVKTSQTQLNDFLCKALDYTRDPLGPFFDTVSRREFLGFVDYDDAHAAEILFKPGPQKDFKFSVDVRVKVRERSEEFRATDALSEFSFGSSFSVIHPENIVSKTVEREMAVTVEGEADVTSKGARTILFTSIRDKATGGIFALVANSKG